MTNFESGLKGVSGISGDMKTLLDSEMSDHRAAEAVELFCYQVRKAIGALSAALGGVDQLVFTGGIGEQSAAIRSRICEGLEYLGIKLDESSNSRHQGQISDPDSQVSVRIIPADEALSIAREVKQLIA
jgi:acetate kinase